jgi:Fe-S-cluster containining protein
MYLQNTNLYMEISNPGSKRKSDKTDYQLLLIASLKKEIESARRLDPEKLASEIEKIGFLCQHCGKCCRRTFGDNRVMLIPAEIEKIREFTGFSKLEIAGPFMPEPSQPDEFEEEERKTENLFGAPEMNETLSSSEFLELLQESIDPEGNIHAFGWMLRRKRNGDCTFLEKETSRCRVYPVRPMLCRTYPFYIEALKLNTCKCEGLGYPISAEDSRKLAKSLLSRYISELEDTLAVYEKYVNFRRGGKGFELAKKKLEKGRCTYVVHDSTGITKFIE